jgi:hypothetical protein
VYKSCAVGFTATNFTGSWTAVVTLWSDDDVMHKAWTLLPLLPLLQNTSAAPRHRLAATAAAPPPWPLDRNAELSTANAATATTMK